MDVFDLREQIVKDYAAFARSFTRVKATDLIRQLDEIYAGDQFWPEPLLQISPYFEQGATIDALAQAGEIDPLTAPIFRVPDRPASPLTLHRHQVQALMLAKQGRSYVVTTGTGSGKSLCFFIPIVDAIIRARAADPTRCTRAIIVYPMNALANSQKEELEKFLRLVSPDQPITFARYTGQEDSERRRDIADNPPDILLTNFMMLEYLMTRQDQVDQDVIRNCRGLQFLVLDELHTYRGRQGADVSLLVRRIRAMLAADTLQCIGTSATMASGSDQARRAAVAGVATKLFGVRVEPSDVVGETLKRATRDDLTADTVRGSLRASIEAGIGPEVTDAELVNHPLAIWVETRLGIVWEDTKWIRARPRTLRAAAEQLAEDSGLPTEQCDAVLRRFLLICSMAEADRPTGVNTGRRGFFAFKLHQFISGAGSAYCTLEAAGRRMLTVNGQQYLPGHPDKRLYPTHFCRDCGQEYHPVFLATQDGARVVLPREIDDVPPATVDGAADGDDRPRYGFLMLEPGDADFDFRDREEDYPDAWIEEGPDGQPRLKADARRNRVERLSVDPSGRVGIGQPAWFIPGKFRFCLSCRTLHAAQGKDNNRLASLSAEGRSSATTLLTHSVLRWMHHLSEDVLPMRRRKLLGFTDNRQDAALQAGHFNDFLFVTLFRAGVLGAIRRAGEGGLTADRLGQAIFRALGFERPGEEGLRSEWLIDPDLEGANFTNAQRSMRQVLSYRAWFDQRRGWRFTNPNLEQLGLVKVAYTGLEELCRNDARFAQASPLLATATAEQRMQAFGVLLDAMRQGLAIDVEVLDPAEHDSLRARSINTLRAPWGLGREEPMRTSRYLMLEPPARRANSPSDEDRLLRAGYLSGLGRELRKPATWGGKPEARQLKRKDYEALLQDMLLAAERAGLVSKAATPFGRSVGWHLKSACVEFHPGDGQPVRGGMDNAYFRSLYQNLAAAIGSEFHHFSFEAREHTAQVDNERREAREARFRYETEDVARLAAATKELRQLGEHERFLPVLFCSPTMELGVDISALNTVYLRNVPPTPANYAQRSGRAGRSGMPSLVLTYCAARSPHDQYFFADPPAMVHGEVKAPTLDLANEELVRSHLQAVWLASTATPIKAAIAEVLEPDEARGLPMRAELREALSAAEIAPTATQRIRRVLDLLVDDLTPEAAPWFESSDALTHDAVTHAVTRFDRAFDRWRDLFMSAARQRDQSRRTMDTHGLQQAEINAARVLHAQAMDQLSLLKRGQESLSSDFYTYRYLATEGFLPGYNFPRLPLTAFIPGRGERGGAYLQRPRFLALSEFGPRSLVYHEGRAYRVTAAQLSARGESASTRGQLNVDTAVVCKACGGAHFQSDPADRDRSHCRSCGAPLTDNADIILNLYRIENVRTSAAERITVNDEERQRQGFDLQTVFRWARRENGQPDVRVVVAEDAEGPIARLRYGPSAEISRLNKGLRRRADPHRHGFMINPLNGTWAKMDDDDADGEPDPTKLQNQLIVPWVVDRKNALLLQVAEADVAEGSVATLQYALKRGIETVFQLEESELLAEPLPDRRNRRGILFYEATEGGAGVLTRLVHDEEALARVAHAALGVMHLGVPAFGSPLPPLDALQDKPGVHCVAGCYRCLLSYYNQPDHPLIDRRDPLVRGLLRRLAAVRTRLTPATPCSTEAGGLDAAAPTPNNGFTASAHGLPEPDKCGIELQGVKVMALWREQRVALVPPVDDGTALADAGLTVVQWSDDPLHHPALVDALRAHLL